MPMFQHTDMAHERLNAEALAKSLKTERFGQHLVYYETVSSTNTIAGDAARSGCPEGQVVVANAQTIGKGRLGRSWDSPAGKNLYLSIVLRPKMNPTEATKLTLLGAVAVADTVRQFMDTKPRIKWPNDILLCGRKVAGILCELVTERESVGFVVMGIGVNLNYPRGQMKREIQPIATSLMEESGQEVDRTRFTQMLIERLERLYVGVQKVGFNVVARSWNRYARIEGQWMRAQLADRTIVGKARGLDENGFLLLEQSGGSIETILAGDVTLVGAPSDAPE